MERELAVAGHWVNMVVLWHFILEVTVSPEKTTQRSRVLSVIRSGGMHMLQVSSLEVIGCRTRIVPSDAIAWCMGGSVYYGP